MIDPGQKKKMMMKKSDWADLPMEILRMIMEKLFWSERLPSCLVCKTWHECFLEIQNDEQFLPWVMTMEDGGIYKLGDPSKQASHTVEGTSTHDLLSYACDSRYGWVLFSNNLKDQYTLYSPFTNEVIKFPKLIEDDTCKATFSHSPGSPNCMHESGIFPMNTRPCQCSLLVAFNGDILVQTLSSGKTRMQYWRLDLSEDKWVVVEDETMKKHVIFEGIKSFTVPAVRDARQSAGMVYSFIDYLSDLSCFPFDADLIFREREVHHHRWLNGDYKWLKEDYKPLDKIWIQPLFQRIWR
ncbi:hypothetical protein LWI28_001559 [Acer negundo]|uniref:F-box domain-containing protein n=1 Tax=Acer negundo TaxID=4023 RepID=A0AAD5J2N8_ACENE|nr:hypothetical protein LWI28_001559 [Acer negundo]